MSEARARRTDPSTSHEAAARAERHGAKTQRATILTALRGRPGLTSAEYAVETGIDRHNAARRLSELKHDGVAKQCEKRICGVKGTKAVTWYPAVKQKDGQEKLF